MFGFEEPIVQLSVRERVAGDPESGYWGWLKKDARGSEDRYTMVWPSRVQLDMCFPYGPQVEMDHGCGRVVNLIVEEVAVVEPGAKK